MRLKRFGQNAGGFLEGRRRDKGACLQAGFGNPQQHGFTRGWLLALCKQTIIHLVHFYAVKRIGGGVANSEAIKLMKFAAS